MPAQGGPEPAAPSLLQLFRLWLRDSLQQCGWVRTLGRLLVESFEFLRDSTPSRRRQRYGDMDFDWDNRVNTTSATVRWRDRLRGALAGAPYQPTEPALFHQMMASLPIRHSEFTFIDLGSGKGRVLLMASEYPFQRILGIELLPELHRIAQENIRNYRSRIQKCTRLESRAGDACEFTFPPEPAVLYLFNPLLPSAFEIVLANLEASLRRHPRPVYLLYHNPLLEDLLARSSVLRKIGGTHQFVIYGT